MIAMALACRPKVLIADEPTTALDPTVQAQILELIRTLQKDFGTAVIFISHDLGVISSIADRTAVLYAGKVVETGQTGALFDQPKHPYTQGLLRALPDPESETPPKMLFEIEGNVPPPGMFPEGCRFAPRCDWVQNRCRSQRPELRRIQDVEVSCWECERG